MESFQNLQNYLGNRVVVGCERRWYTNIRNEGHTQSGHAGHSMGYTGRYGSLNGSAATNRIRSLGFAGFTVIEGLHALQFI